ncbi:MAG TPA: serine/threonine-protein kinase [Thermoanaerobaculia bacterium]|nr:serine/threonine-protein kinase [Thermoanaerobaculia bacterium]
MKIPVWARPVVLLAAAKVVAVSVVYVCIGRFDAQTLFFAPKPAILDLAIVVGFGCAALFLLVACRTDARAAPLAGFFLLVGTAFTSRPLYQLAAVASGPWLDLVRVANAFRLDCFLPLFLWMFVREFPDTPVPRRSKRLLALGTGVSGVVGFALLVTNLAATLLSPRNALVAEASKTGEGIYYSLVGFLILPTLPLLVYKAMSAEGTENRRVRVFVLAIVAGLTPSMVEILLELCSSKYSNSLKTSVASVHAMLFISIPFLLTVPLTTGYAVLVHHVLGVKLIARRALQYALARLSTLILAAVPFLALCAFLYLHRDRTVASLLSGTELLLLASATVAGIAALRYRTRLLDAIDRRFFREQYDARQILTLVVKRIRDTHQVRDLAELLCRGIDQALHLEGIALLVEDRRAGTLFDPRSRARRLDSSSSLAQLISNASDPLDVDLEDPRSLLTRLPEADRHWLLDAGFRLLVPIVARDGSLLGLLGLGEKKSGLPFLREDRKLLYDIANSAALGLELDLKHTWGPSGRREEEALAGLPSTKPDLPPTENAKECATCGTLFLPFTVFCGTCSRRLESALVPYVLPGKFRIERRLGTGGMGVVYRGTDLALGRAVAVKTLRRVSPEDAMRLRREARAAAAVSHPHLAAIYGLETWQGTPLLILELLEGGTLAQRLEKQTLPPLEMVDLGIAMAGGLEKLHAADILHRDLKPSNIGYTRDGAPKLMDFGIARVMLDLRPERSHSSSLTSDDPVAPLPPTWTGDQTPTSITVSRQLVGTLSYLSPEALNGEQANPSFDLWGLCIVLYECLLGRKVFAGTDVKQTMARIRLGRVPDFEQTCPEGDPAVGEFFRLALHKTTSRRPATARELLKRLEQVRARLAK